MKRKTMSVPEMGRLLGLKKTERYWLIKKNYFRSFYVDGHIRIDVASFEEWYAGQIHYKKKRGEAPGRELKQWSLSIEDTAEMLGITETTVYDILEQHHLPTVKIDNKCRILKDEFESWYRAQKRYIKVAEREANEDYRNSVSMPEFARMLGISRKEGYKILQKKKNREIFRFVFVGEQKRVTKESIRAWCAVNGISDLFAEELEPDDEQTQEVDEEALVEEMRYISRKEASRIVGVSEATIDNWMKDRLFAWHKTGRYVRIDRYDFRKFTEVRKNGINRQEKR